MLATGWNSGGRSEYAVMDVVIRVEYDADGLSALLGEMGELVLTSGTSTVSLRQAAPETKRPTGRYVLKILEVRIVKPVSAKREELLEKLDADTVHLDTLPPSLRDFMEEAGREIGALAEQAVGLIRWHSDCRSEPQPLTLLTPMQWSIDGEDWRPFITGTQVGIRFYGSPTLTESLRHAIQVDLSRGVKEPVSSELFYEAEALRESHPRSALLTLVSAAEFSVKSCIAEQLPQSEWLILNMPSPDIRKLITEYLPKINEDAERAFREPRGEAVTAWLKELEAAVRARNALAHRGQDAPDQASLDRKFNAVWSLLRLMDYFSGNSWALGHLQPEWLAQLHLKRANEETTTEAG